MSVLHLAFPCIGILARSVAHGPAPVETPDLHGILPYAREAGLPDVRFRRTTGPETLASATHWLRGDMGAIACVIEEPDRVTLHIMSRDGSPMVVRTMHAAWHPERPASE